MSASFVVVEDPAGACAERLADAARAGGHIALTGGSTPRQAYERLAGMDVDWRGVTLWWSDERVVPPDDERSNYGMVKAALLDRIDGDPPRVCRVEGERGDAHAAADSYEALMRETFGAGVPRLDLILLGLGADAHVASLFPGQEALEERDRLAVAVEQPRLEPFVPRVTMTLPVLNAGREVLFLITGAAKADAVARAFAGPPQRDVPGSLIHPESGSLTVILDPAAAAKLPVEVEGERTPSR